MIDYTRSRSETYECGFHEPAETLEVTIPWGCFLEADSDSSGKIIALEIFEERPMRKDVPVSTVVCNVCGCVSGLKKKKNV